nr:MAG TPA: hypothetical protein [Caudoviricetes sp.]
MDRTNSVLDTGTDRTKDRVCPVHEIKIMHLKGVLGQDKVGVRHRVCPGQTNHNTKSV